MMESDSNSMRRNNLAKAIAKKKHDQDVAKFRAMTLRCHTFQRKIDNLLEKIDILSEEKKSIEEKYTNLKQDHENMLKELLDIKRTYQESINTSNYYMTQARNLQNQCNQLNHYNFTLNEINKKQVQQFNEMCIVKDKEIRNIESRFKYRVGNSVLLNIRKKQLHFCSDKTQKDWINTIIKAIIKTNIDEIPPSNVLIRLSNAILKLVDKAKERENQWSGKSSDSGEKEKKEKENQGIGMLFDNPNELDFNVTMPPQRQEKQSFVFGITLLDQNDNATEKETVAQTDGSSYLNL